MKFHFRGRNGITLQCQDHHEFIIFSTWISSIFSGISLKRTTGNYFYTKKKCFSLKVLSIKQIFKTENFFCTNSVYLREIQLYSFGKSIIALKTLFSWFWLKMYLFNKAFPQPRTTLYGRFCDVLTSCAGLS